MLLVANFATFALDSGFPEERKLAKLRDKALMMRTDESGRRT